MDAHEYADRVALEGGYPCVHGHINCALKRGGPCQDELLTQHEAAGGCRDCGRVEGPPPYDAATATGMYDPEGS